MRYVLTVFVCKIFIFLLRLTGSNGTSAPGKLAFKLYPDILKVFEKKVKKEIIAVLGTNGKTTTNNLLADCLENAGYSVACNRIGANMDEGAVVAFIKKANLFGKIDVDYACLEMDEGWAEYIMKRITPHKIIIGNLFRDQLDRYGEIDITMNFLRRAVKLAPNATLIVNADDPLCVATVEPFDNKKVYFGIKENVNGYESPIKEGRFCYLCKEKLNYNFYHFSQLGDYYCSCGFKRPEIDFNAKNIIAFPKLSFDIENLGHIEFGKRGIYNIYNILAAAAVVSLLKIDFSNVAEAAKNYVPQAGRMQEFKISDKPVYLILAKNPAGFTQSALSVVEDKRTKDLIIAINDGIQDGTDVSWLWDVDFEAVINEKTLSYSVSGVRYADMGLRLKYSEIEEEKITLSPDIRKRIKELLTNGKGEVLYILVNYTALYSTESILKELEKGGMRNAD